MIILKDAHFYLQGKVKFIIPWDINLQHKFADLTYYKQEIRPLSRIPSRLRELRTLTLLKVERSGIRSPWSSFPFWNNEFFLPEWQNLGNKAFRSNPIILNRHVHWNFGTMLLICNLYKRKKDQCFLDGKQLLKNCRETRPWQTSM